MTGAEMTWVSPVYLRVLMDRARACLESADDPAILVEALQYAERALDGEVPGPEPKATAEPPLPDGMYGRVELPGYRQHTGWITEETRFGVQMAMVRGWDGQEMAAVAIGPASQVVYLPTPLKRPEPQAALPAGDGFGDEYAEMPDDSRPF